MESKFVVLSVLLLSLVLAQVQVDAKSCCPSTTARNIYNTCRLTGASRDVCARLSGCIIQTSPICRSPNPHETLDYSVVMKSCCPSTKARIAYNTCRLTGKSQYVCSKLAGCIIQREGIACESPFDNEILQTSGDITTSYCKLGCASSVCNATTTLQNDGEAMNEVVEQCINACSELCTKGSTRALEIA